MDFLSPITEIVSRVIDCSTKHLHYLRKLEKKLNKLNEKMEELNEIKSDVNNKVLAAEAQLMVRTSQVSGWMQRVEAKRLEVEKISLEGTQHLERRCLNGCCPRNCWSSYKLGKKAVRKVLDVEELKCNGVFDSVAEKPLLVVTRELPEVTPIVGLDSIFDRAWNFLGENSVRIMGLYGMGGVGKTTLLKRINNELSKRGSDFNIVIWLVISKEVNMARVQEEIGNKLGLSLSNTENIFNLLKTKRFLLLLDDIWQRIDLVSIGVPLPSSQNKSKILFTTRSETVCGRMEADKIIRVECLNWEAAWTLFQEKVGYKALNSDVDIPRLAKIVAKECLGLPLALITIGRSMANKKTCHEWEHAISVLKNSAAEFPGMGDEVLPLLKFSYDFLPNDVVRSCFLFCSVYSEDYSIEIQKLIEKWIGEGYISGYDNWKEALNSGYNIIGILTDSCLLEKAGFGFVKMHDVIRDLALWIACECGKVKDKYYVKAGLGLFEAPQAGKWPTMAEKISLFDNRFFKLESIPKCPNLSTMLLSNNKRLQYIHNDFFLCIPSLRFLDLSRTRITKVPSSICKLFELEFLDLSFTDIKSLPYEMRNLTKLKYLSLRNQKNITTYEIPHGIITNLLNLEFLMLDVKKSEYPNGSFEIDELWCLNYLKYLEIRFFSDSKDVGKFLNYHKLANCARKLSILTYKDITSLSLSASSSSSTDLCLGHLKGLENLCIYDCSEIKELRLNKETIEFESLQRMDLINLPKLIISWDANNLHLGSHFRKLICLQLDGCGAMVDLTWLLLIPNLQSLWIESCNSLEEILSGTAYDQNTTFLNLQFLRLKYLPNLQSICSMSALPFRSLNTLVVHESPKLKRLPLDLNSAKNTLQKIGARQVWWDGLEWENETIKTHFAKFLSSPF